MWNIKNNSKKIKKNDIFICTHDELSNRHNYIKDAIKKRPSAIIIDEDINENFKVPMIKVNNTNDTLFQIANDYYERPLEKIKLIGITGTDGKTTTATLIKQLLDRFTKTAYLGTNGFSYDDIVIKTKNTTPNNVEILKYANIAVKNNCKYLVMEVSSEGMLHMRCNNLLFERVILTNISKDHINIHKSFDNYLKHKLSLFKQINNNSINILNIDDKYYDIFAKINDNKIISYGKDKNATFSFCDIKEKLNGTNFNLLFDNKKYYIESPLVGKFNVYNLVCAISVIYSLGYPIEDIIKNIKWLKPVNGRMNFIKNNLGVNIILDYAHTSKATLEVLEYINRVKTGKIITVVGCAGNRYKEKRKEIGKIVSQYSDFAIFTMDDPRNENINDIFKDMKEEVIKNNILTIKNRKKAIKKALNIAKENDIILILGKGTDNYMAIKNKYKKYNDLTTLKKLMH